MISIYNRCKHGRKIDEKSLKKIKKKWRTKEAGI